MTRAKANPLQGREIILEYIPHGNAVKVTAFDTATMTEVSIQGPKTASEKLLERNALRRLEYVMRKKGFID